MAASDKKAQIMISAKDDTSAALKNIQRGLANLKNGAESSFASIKNLGVALGAMKLVESTIANIGASFNFTDKLNDLSEQFGLSIEKLSELDYIAGQNGTTFEVLQKGYSELSKGITEAANGNKESAADFKALGISVRDASGHVKTADQVFEDLADVFQKSANDPAKLATALKLMGKSGRELIPTLNGGSEGIKELRKEAESLGIIISTETAAQIGGLGDTFDKFAKISRNSVSGLIAEVAPGLDILVNGLINFKQELKSPQDQSAIVDTQVAIAEFSLKALDAFDAVSGYIIGPLKAGWEFLQEIVSFAMTEVGKYVDDFKKNFEGDGLDIKTILTGLGTGFTGFFEVVKGVFKGILDVASFLVTGITLAFKAVGGVIGGIGAAVAKAVGGDFTGAFDVVKQTTIDTAETVKKFESAAVKGIVNVATSVGTGIGNAVGAVTSVTQEGIDAVNKMAENSKTKLGETARKDFDKTLTDAENLRKAIEKRNEDAKNKAKGGDKGTGVKPNSAGKADADKELEQLIKLNEEKIKIAQKGFDYQKNLNDALYRANFKTVESYYEEKDRVEKEEVETMRKNIGEQISLIEGRLNKDKGNLKLQKELAKAQELLTESERKNKIEAIKNADEKEKAILDYIDSVKLLQNEIDKITGKDNTIELDIKIRDLKEKFKNSQSDLDKVVELEKVLRKNDDYTKSLTKTDEINKKLALTEREIAFERDNGSKSILTAYTDIAKARASALNDVKKEAETIKASAQSDEQKERLRELELQIKEMSKNLDPLAKELDDKIGGAFDTFFDSVITGSKSVSEAFKDMAGSITKDLLTLVNKDISKTLYTSLFPDMGNGGGAGALLSNALRGGQSASGGGSSSGGFASLFGAGGKALSESFSSTASSAATGAATASSSGGFFSSLFSSFASAFGGKDTGGMMKAGQPQVVGEFGKEIFVPRASGMLLNANESANMGQKNITINNVQNIKTADVSSFKNSRGQMYAGQQSQLNKYSRYL